MCREQKGKLAGSFGLLHIFSIFPSMQLVKCLSRQKRNSVAELLLLVSFFWNTLRNTVAVSLSNCWANKVCNKKSFESNTLPSVHWNSRAHHNSQWILADFSATLYYGGFSNFFLFLVGLVVFFYSLLSWASLFHKWGISGKMFQYKSKTWRLYVNEMSVNKECSGCAVSAFGILMLRKNEGLLWCYWSLWSLDCRVVRCNRG